MTSPHDQLDVTMLNVASKMSGLDSSGPSSSPTTDSEVECSSPGLRASVAAVRGSKLRAILIKLAESSPQFHRAVMKELACAEDSEESSPTSPKIRGPQRRRSKSGSHRKTLTISATTPIRNHKRQISTATERSYQSECVYHPGNLKQEVYEFLSGTPDDTTHEVVRTLTMWSCCDEDEWSPGCMTVTMIPAQYKVEHDDRYDANLSHNDVFPDSDLEDRPDLSSRLLSQTKWSTRHL